MPCLETTGEILTMLTMLDNAYVNSWSNIFRAREDIAHEVNPEDFTQHVVRAPDGIVWTMSEEDVCTMFPQTGNGTCPDGFYRTAYTDALAALVPDTCLKHTKLFLAWRRPPGGFAASRTVFISKFFAVDDLGGTVRSPSALRPLTLCNCDCKVITQPYAVDFTASPPIASTRLRDAQDDGI